MSNKHPRCECKEKRYSYFRRRYRNGTLHLLRKCEACGKIAPNAMTQQDSDKNWVDRRAGRYRAFCKASPEITRRHREIKIQPGAITSDPSAKSRRCRT